MYFSGHLLDGFSKALSAPEIKEMRDLNETDEQGELLHADKERVVVAGIVNAITHKSTKNGAPMAFFTLEDRYAEMECLVFPKIYEACAHLLRADVVLRVEGTLSVREEEAPKILVSSLSELPDNNAYLPPTPKTRPARTDGAQGGANTVKHISPQKAKILYLRVPSMDSREWSRARNILEIFEGTLPVSVYDTASATYQKQSLGFDCTAYTLGELVEILGADNVVLK